MKGVIKTYLPSKSYGFIKGDDEKDYFFHIKDIKSKKEILDGMLVSFEESANPKGYTAKNIQILDKECPTYEVPKNFIFSKSDELKDFQILSSSKNPITITTNSPDKSRDILKEEALKIGANSVICYKYTKTTRAIGNYNYSVHSASAFPVFAGKKSFQGKIKDINDLSSFEGLEQEFDANNNSGSIGLFGMILLFVIFMVIFLSLFLTSFV